MTLIDVTSAYFSLVRDMSGYIRLFKARSNLVWLYSVSSCYSRFVHVRSIYVRL